MEKQLKFREVKWFSQGCQQISAYARIRSLDFSLYNKDMRPVGAPEYFCGLSSMFYFRYTPETPIRAGIKCRKLYCPTTIKLVVLI